MGIFSNNSGSVTNTNIYVSSNKLYFNPSTGGLTANAFIPQGNAIPISGMFQPGSNIVAFSTSNTERLRIDANGNVAIGTTPTSYALLVNGSFAATTKSFLIPHPNKHGMKLRYASLEGPENGVYIRGRLTNQNHIELPDYWHILVDINTVTVQLTAIGENQNLYISSIDDCQIIIENSYDSIINCFYIIFAERRDVDKLLVEYME